MEGRRLQGVWHVLVIFGVALIVAVLLGAKPLLLGAEALDESAFRTAAVAVTRPLATASDFLYLDEPWNWATGYSEDATTPEAGAESTTTSGTVATGTTVGVTHASVSTTTSSVVTSSTTTTEPQLPLFTTDRPLRVLVVGDSLVELIGYALQRLAETYPLQVKIVTKVSSGLVRPDFFNWPQKLSEAVGGFQPYVTVMLFGGNEKQIMHYEEQSLEPFSEAWTAEYTKRVIGAIDITVNAGGRVVWMGMPIMQSPKFSETVRKLNAIYSGICSQHPKATYVDGYSLFADPQGEYSAYLEDSSGEQRKMRISDGIHFTNAGGDRAAEAVLEVLLQYFRLEK